MSDTQTSRNIACYRFIFSSVNIFLSLVFLPNRRRETKINWMTEEVVRTSNTHALVEIHFLLLFRFHRKWHSTVRIVCVCECLLLFHSLVLFGYLLHISFVVSHKYALEIVNIRERNDGVDHIFFLFSEIKCGKIIKINSEQSVCERLYARDKISWKNEKKKIDKNKKKNMNNNSDSNSNKYVRNFLFIFGTFSLLVPSRFHILCVCFHSQVNLFSSSLAMVVVC